MDHSTLMGWLTSIGAFLNSGFVSSATGALLGAYFGARAATKFADKRERHRLRVQRFQDVVTGINLATAVCNHSLTFKDQLIRPSVKTYFTDRERYQELLGMPDADAQKAVFQLQYDFQEISFFRHEADELRTTILRSCADQPKLVMACMQLWQCLHSLEHSVANRTSEIARIAPLKNELNPIQFANIYFGIEDVAGNIDMRLYHTMEAIRDLLDSAIFFSDLIASNLSDISKDMSKDLGSEQFKPISWDLKNIKDPTLLPNPKDFPDWL